MYKVITLLALLALPLAAWAFVNPARVLAPQLAGLECQGSVCVDDLSRLAEATELYEQAVRFVQINVGQLQSMPRAVFCAKAACSKSFGFSSANAYNVGTFAIVISHRGWTPFFVRHELIHHLQNEHLGSVRAWLFKPTWFREGMAYSLSQDPRRPLPQPSQSYRLQFESWFERIGIFQLWTEAERL